MKTYQQKTKKVDKGFTPLEKATEFIRWPAPYKADGDLMPPLAQTVRGRSSLTGFTLVEVMVSLLILLITAAGIFSSFIVAQNYVVRAKLRIAAVNFARAKFEELRPYVRQDNWANSTPGVNWLYAPETSSQLYSEPFSFSSTLNGTLNYTVTNTDNTAYRAVSLTASWQTPD